MGLWEKILSPPASIIWHLDCQYFDMGHDMFHVKLFRQYLDSVGKPTVSNSWQCQINDSRDGYAMVQGGAGSVHPTNLFPQKKFQVLIMLMY